MSSAALLEFVARLTYNVDGLSAKLRLYFSQFLTFHFSKTISVNQIENIENKRAVIRFVSDEEMQRATASLTTNEKCWAVAAIYFLQAEVERQDDRVLSRRLGALADEVIRILSLEGEKALIESEHSTIDREFRAFNERPVVRIPARIWPMVLDFFVRCSLLIYFGINDLDKSRLTGLNISIVTCGMLLLVAIYNRRDKRYNRRLLESYSGIAKYRIEYRVTASQYTLLAMFLGLSTFISYLLPDQLHAFAFLGLAFYYFIYLRFLCLGRISENDLVRQLEEKIQHTDRLDVDENDEMIVNLETQLHASTSRLDAYVLESALFGALSFSGFLQIMASDLISFTDLENFATNIFTASQALIHLQWDGFGHGLSLLNNKVSLFCLVSVESLVCSIFFIAVIASRLRFSDIADKVRTALNLARAFNEKEETVYHESEKSDIRQSRLTDLTQKVNRQLFEANQSLIKVGPIVAYMEYFRNAGILVFLIILISSSLFITSVLGWIFLVLAGATYLYFNRERIGLNLRAALLQLRILFLRWSAWLFAVALAPFVVSVVLRNFTLTNNPELEALGSLILGFVLPTWLLLASHFDQEFGDIEGKETRQRVSRWNIVRNLIAAMLFIYCLGMCFKILHLNGADELIMIGMTSFTFLMYFTGYYLSKVKWLGLVSGVMMAIATTGMLFKTLHLTGGQEMLLIGVIGLLACSVVFVLRPKAFHLLFVRFCLAILIVSFAMRTNAILRLEMAYAHRTLDVAQFFQLFDSLNDDYLSTDANAQAAVQSTESYISKYGNAVPYHVVYAGLVRSYNDLGRTGVQQFKNGETRDTTILNRALMAVRERDRILDQYNFLTNNLWSVDLDLEADILLLLNRKQEAEAAVNTLLGKLQYEGHRNEVVERFESLKGGGN